MAEFNVEARILGILKQYTGDVMDAVDEAVKVCGEGLKKEIQANSPKRTGYYKKGWRVQYTSNSRGDKGALVGNKTSYRLTHLLENPHKKRFGKGYTDPLPHIGPAEEKWNRIFEQMCEEACKPK